MGKHPPPCDHVAYCEEADDDGEPLTGVEPQYARSVVAEKPNTGRSRRESRSGEPISPIVHPSTDPSDSTAHPSSKRKPKMKSRDERRKSTPVVHKRPIPHSTKTAPLPPSRASDDSSYYGIVPNHTVVPAASRPRAQTRPESYYGQPLRPQQRPPLSTSAYYHQPPPPSQFSAPPYHHPPPPSWVGGPPGPPGPPMGSMAMVHQHPMPPPPGPDYFARDLSLRFKRPGSVGYNHNPPPNPHPREYEPVQEKALARRASVSRKVSKNHEERDRAQMPPPPRPKSARQERVVFRPPPPSNMRKSVGFDDDDLDDLDDDDDSLLYDSVSRRASVEYGTGALPIRGRRQSQTFEIDSDYDSDDLDSEPAAPPRGRRNSYVNFEEKVRDASRYQEDVSGSTPPLTAEALRQVKNGGSSRSTRSSGSRDESEYKHSATTRTTRSGSGEDDITIKIPMGAVVEVGNTKIHCRDGGDISVGRGGNGRGSSDRGNSTYGDDRKSTYDDRKSTYDDRKSTYGDDRKSRADRSSTRTRASSQAESYTRVAPPLQPPRMPPLLNHGYAPHSSYWDRYDNNYF
ncbi:hypothetical protein F5X99DRAFT_173974 [Biscogniauxia marginata]|nr:hypothetical protein F5X99DRAFT_173974 [Biscogniauxia marginata]